MKKLYILILIGVTLIIQSCNNKETFEILELPEKRHLSSKIISIPVDLYMPSKMLICEDKLVIKDNTADSLFKVFNLPELSYAYSFGNIGPSPNEISFINQESFIYDNQFKFLDNDILKSKDLSDSISSIKVEFPIITGHNSREILSTLKKQNDSLFVTNSPIDDISSEYRIINTQKGVGKVYGCMPSWDESLKTPIEKQVAYMKTICVHPFNNKKMVFYYHYPVVRLYSSSDQLEKQFSLGTVSPKSINFNDKIIYFTEPYVTAEYIYVMWVNKTKEAVETNIEAFTPEILVFDWSGNIVNRFSLDKPVITFAVKNNKIYATSFTDLNQIYLFDIPSSSESRFVSYSNGIMSFEMLSDYSITEASIDTWNTFKMIERDEYKMTCFYLTGNNTINTDINWRIGCTYPKNENDVLQVSSYLKYRKTYPEQGIQSYKELNTFESKGRKVFPIEKNIVNFNPFVNRNDTLHITEFLFKEKNAIISLYVCAKQKDLIFQKYFTDIQRIIDSMSLK